MRRRRKRRRREAPETEEAAETQEEEDSGRQKVGPKWEPSRGLVVGVDQQSSKSPIVSISERESSFPNGTQFNAKNVIQLKSECCCQTSGSHLSAVALNSTAILSLCWLTVILLLTQNSVCDFGLTRQLGDSSPSSTTTTANEENKTVILNLHSQLADLGGSGQLNGTFSALSKLAVAAAEHRSTRGVDTAEEAPLLSVGAGQRVELACHMLGKRMELNEEGKWTVRGSSLVDANDDGDLLLGVDDNRRPVKKYDLTALPLNNNAETDDLLGGDKSFGRTRDDDLHEDDLVSLIFWYKDDNPTPIYTLDARKVAFSALAATLPPISSDKAAGKSQTTADKSSGRGEHKPIANNTTTDTATVGGDHHKSNHHSTTGQLRAIHSNRQLLANAKHYPPKARSSGSVSHSLVRLDTTTEYPVLKLIINGTSTQDSGNYKCRIDFRRSPTISQVVRLLVKVPISRVEISAGQARQLIGHTSPASIGPPGVLHTEGEQAEFTCVAFDGSPKPTLTWLVRWRLAGGQATTKEAASEQLLWSTEEELSSGLTKYGTLIEIASLYDPSRSNGSESDDNRDELVETNRLTITPLTRRFHLAQIGCRASQPPLSIQNGSTNYRQSLSITHSANSQSANSRLQTLVGADKMIDDFATTKQHNNNVLPIQTNQWLQIKWFELKLNLKPQHIEIVSDQVKPEVGSTSVWVAELSEHEQAKFVCRSSGSSPAARLRWSWEEDPHSDISKSSSSPTGYSGTSSTSLFDLAAVSRHHHLATLLCTASNEKFLASGRKDGTVIAKIKLLVKFKPVVRALEWSTNEEIDPPVSSQKTHPKLGINRRLKCLVQSNPPINQLVWLVNEQPLAKIMAPNTVLAAASALSDTTHTSPNGAQPAEIAQQQQQQNNNKEVSLPAATTVERQETIDELLNHWTTVPLVSGAIDGSKYKVEGNTLTVMNLTKLDSKDEYKCLAINIMGESSSSKLQLPVNYRPLCLRQSRNGRPQTTNSADPLLGLETDHVWQVAASSSSSKNNTISCMLDAHPAPTEIIWSFVPLSELAKLIASGQQVAGTAAPTAAKDTASNDNNKVIVTGSGDAMTMIFDRDEPEDGGQVVVDSNRRLNHSSFSSAKFIHLESKSSEVRYADFVAQTKHQYGLLLCRALNELGWQERPCVNLVLPPSELREPSADNCTVEPILEQQRRATKQQHIAISVDCSRVNDKDKLLFQLAISRRDVRGRTRDIPTTGGHLNNKRLLFTETSSQLATTNGSGQLRPVSRISITDLLEWDLPNEGAQNDQEQVGSISTVFVGSNGRSAAANSGEMNETETVNEMDENGGGGILQQQQELEVGGRIGGWSRSVERKRKKNLAKIMTLDEQVDLLKELVFTIRASNLIKTSEPHAIYGSELQLNRLSEEAAASDSIQLQQQQQQFQQVDGFSSLSTGAAQVSRSTSQESAIEETSLGLTIPSHSAIQGSNSSGSRRTNPVRTTTLGSTVANWSQHRYEISITIAAICGTVVLSILTLTLIVVVLRERRGMSAGKADEDYVGCGGVPGDKQVQRRRLKFDRKRKKRQKQDITNCQIAMNGPNIEQISPAAAGDSLELTMGCNKLVEEADSSDGLWRISTTNACNAQLNNSTSATTCNIRASGSVNNELNFLAPPVRNGGGSVVGRKSPNVIADKTCAGLYAVNHYHHHQQHLASLHSGSHLSLSHLHEASVSSAPVVDFGTCKADTLYVIGSSNEFELTTSGGDKLGAAATNTAAGAEFNIDADGSSLRDGSSHLCEQDYHLLRGDQGQQLLSYCSPSICNSSHYDEQSLTVTSGEHQPFVQLGNTHHHHGRHHHAHQFNHPTLIRSSDCEEDIISTTDNGNGDGQREVTTGANAVCNNMYLFSFL